MVRIKFNQLKIGDKFMDMHKNTFIKTTSINTNFGRVKANCVLLSSAHLQKGSLLWNTSNELVNKIGE